MYPWAVPHRAGDTLTCAQNAYACSPSQSARASPRAILPASRARRVRGLRSARASPRAILPAARARRVRGLRSARASPRAILPASRARGLRCVGLRGLPDLPKIGSRA